MDKLKNSLGSVGTSASGLSRISEIARNTTFGDLANKALEVGRNLTVSQGLGIAAFGGIAGAAVAAGSKIVTGFFQVMKDGFAEYETQINSVQTILANTAQNGTTLAQVNSALDELNSYADKTIYNFTEMTNSIGTFTVAGVGLEDATAAVKGFSNMAALSGANAQQAAGATRQLAQAMSSGVVKLQDWMSIENAGIGGKQFQEAIMTTARMHGVAVDEMIAKNGSFRLSLQEGWLSAEIMTETLKAMTGDLSEEQLKQMGYSEEQAAQMKKLAQAGLDSATQIRTFTQMIGTWGEALGSGWSKTWQLIFGDFGEAQSLFTSVGNWVGDLINKMSDARNNTLQLWRSFGGREALIRALGFAFENIWQVLSSIGKAFNSVFGGNTAVLITRLTFHFGVLMSYLSVTENTANKIQRTFAGLFAAVKIVLYPFIELGKTVFYVAMAILNALYPAITGTSGGILAVTATIGDFVVWLSNLIQKLNLSGIALKILIPPINLLGAVIRWIVGGLQSFFKWLDIGGRVKAASDAVGGLSGALGTIMTALKASPVFQTFAAGIEKVKEAFAGVKAAIQDFGDKVGAKLGAKLASTKAAVSNFFAGFNVNGLTGFQGILEAVMILLEKFALKLDISGKAEWLANKLNELGAAISALFDKIKNSAVWDKFGNGMAKVGDKVSDLAHSFQDWINGQSDVKSKATEVGNAVSDMGNKTATAAAQAGNAAKQNFLSKWLDDIKRMANTLHLPELFETVKQKLIEFKNFFTQTLGPAIKQGASKAFGSIGEALGKANENLKSYDMGKILVTAMGGGVLYAITTWIKSFKDNFDKIGNLADKIGETFDKLGDVLSAFETKIKTEALQKIAIALLLLAAALVVMALVPFPKLMQSIGALGVVIYLLTDAMKALDDVNTDGIWKLTPVLVSLGVTMILLASAISIMGKMKPEAALQGVITLGVLIAYLTGMLYSISANKNAPEGSRVFMSLAVSMVILATAVAILGSLPMAVALQGIIGLGVIIAALAGFMFVVTKNPNMASGAGVLLSLAISCTILVSAIWLLGSMDTGKLVQGVLALGVVIAALVVAMTIAARGAGIGAAPILAMSVALLILVGVVSIFGDMPLGKLVQGMVALAAGLTILCVAMLVASNSIGGAVALGIMAVALVPFANAMQTLSSISWAGLAVGLVAMAAGFAIFLAAAFVAQMVAPGIILLTVALLALGIALIPISIGMAAFAAVLGICATTGAAAFLVLTEGLKQLAAILPQVAIDVATAIANFIITLGAKAPELAVAMAALLGAIIYAINANIPGIVATLFILIQAMLTELANHAYEFGEKGATILANFLNGIADNIGKVIDAATNVILNFLDGIARNGPKIIDKGMWTVLKLLEGVRDAINKYAPRFNKVGREIAWAIVDGMTNGLASKAWSFGESMLNVAKKGYNKVKSYFKIHSPSRLMMELGGYVGEGLAIGIEDTGDRVADAGGSMAGAAYDAMSKALDGVNELIEDDPSFKPEIKPILDLTEMQKQAKGINNFMPAIGVTAQAANAARPPAPIAVDNSDKNGQNGVTNITFNQTNNSPEALDAATIYRNTNTQLAMAKDKLTL
nr:MAG TPA: tail tape measure [Caudoviricetes sp.]